MENIRIAYIIGNLDLGGTERQFLNLVRHLNRQEFAPHVLAFRCYGVVRDEIERLGIPFRGLGFSAPKGRLHPDSYRRMSRFIRDMVQQLRQINPHIVQSYLPWSNIIGTLAAVIARVPVVITGRRLFINERYMPFAGLDQWLEDLTNLKAAMVITNSEGVRQQCLQRERFLKPEHIRVISNGIETQNSDEFRDTRLKRTGWAIPEESPVVGIVATLHPRKGHSVLFHAAEQILQTYPHTRFLVVGRDEGMRTELEWLAEELQIAHAVIFTGEQHDIPEWLTLCDVYVSASFIEGLSNSLMESMALGKPVVATNIPGNSELVIHEQTGLLVPAADSGAMANAVMRLLADADFRRRLGRCGRKRIEEEFSLQRMIRQFERLYKERVIVS